MPVPRPIDFETPATVGEASPAPRVVGALIDHPEQGKRCRNRFQHPDRRMLESLQIPQMPPAPSMKTRCKVLTAPPMLEKNP
jgi:hypothetical protein